MVAIHNSAHEPPPPKKNIRFLCLLISEYVRVRGPTQKTKQKQSPVIPKGQK